MLVGDLIKNFLDLIEQSLAFNAGQHMFQVHIVQRANSATICPQRGRGYMSPMFFRRKLPYLGCKDRRSLIVSTGVSHASKSMESQAACGAAVL